MFSSASGVYRSSVPNVDQGKKTVSNITFAVYELKDKYKAKDAGLLKLSIDSVPSDQMDTASPTLNTHTFSFYVSDHDDSV